MILYLSTSQEWDWLVQDPVQTGKIYSLNKQGKHRAEDSTEHIVAVNAFMAEPL